MSYPKGILLCVLTTAAAVVPSALFHGAPLGVALLLSLAVSALMVLVDWADAWRYRGEPRLRARWFYVNLTAPAVLVLTIQALGWPIFAEHDRSPVLPVIGISVARLIASVAAIVAIPLWFGFSRRLKKKEPNQSGKE